MIENHWTSLKDIQNKMITNFKLFESKEEDFSNFRVAFYSHINGTLKLKDSYKLVEYSQEYFNWKIPNDLKYEGVVYRMLQFNTEEQYRNVLKNGFIKYNSQRYWSCTKDIKSINYIQKNLIHKKYKYYIIFKFDVHYNDVLFDLNKMYYYLNPDRVSWVYSDENEVIVLTDNFPEMSTDYIYDNGEILLI